MLFGGEDRRKRSGCLAAGPVLRDGRLGVWPFPSPPRPSEVAGGDPGGQSSDTTSRCPLGYAAHVYAEGLSLVGVHALGYHVMVLARLCSSYDLILWGAQASGKIQIY